MLQINELTGGKTDDYYTHIANSINDAVNTYSACFGLDAVSIQKVHPLNGISNKIRSLKVYDMTRDTKLHIWQ